jgi:hypothetical protein
MQNILRPGEAPPLMGPEDCDGPPIDDQPTPPTPSTRSAEPKARINPPDVSPVPLSIAAWLDRDLPEPDPVMGAWLTTTSRALLVASTGLGKTNFAMALAMAVAAGADFLHWRGHRPARVLYVDGEMSRRLLRRRISEAVNRHGSAPAGFFAFSHEDLDGFAPLNTELGQATLDKLIGRIERDGSKLDLIVFDSVMCLTTGDMKDEISWQEILPWIRKLTARSIGQIWVHHTGHDETRSYGTKTREWQLDTVAILEAVKRDDTDVSFALSFSKARERTPENRAEFDRVKIALVDDRWKCEASVVAPPKKISPLGLKFLDALKNAIADAAAVRVGDRRAATLDAWRTECNHAGLINTQEKPASARTLLAKHRRELISANRIACAGDLTWLL